MDWNWKAHSWDLSEFEKGTFPIINTVDGSSSYGERRTRGDFSIDLKLGKEGNTVEDSVNKLKEPGVLKMAASPSRSSKRARATSNGSHTVSCLVDGCTSDLSNCREYHRRHKVCELHSKTPQVSIGGQKQRFCQQCSRFHSLEEFDEGKRSCRKRLDGHNRRRRKSQPEPQSCPWSILSNYQDRQLLPFSSSSDTFPPTTVVNPTWAGAVNAEDLRLYSQHQQLHLIGKQNLLFGSSTNSYKGENIINKQMSPGASVCQQPLKPIALSENDRRDHNMFTDGLTTQVHDSDCALSLLSSPQTRTSGIGLSHMLQPNSVPLGPSHPYSSLEAPVDAVLVSGAIAADVHCQGVFQVGADGSSGNDTPQSLPLRWLW